MTREGLSNSTKAAVFTIGKLPSQECWPQMNHGRGEITVGSTEVSELVAPENIFMATLSAFSHL